MKKLGILVMAMVMVFGMNAVVLGGQSLTHSNTAEVDVTVEDMAEINISELDNISMTLSATADVSDEATVTSDKKYFHIKTNCPANVSITQSWDFGNDVDLWKKDGGDWDVSPNMFVRAISGTIQTAPANEAESSVGNVTSDPNFSNEDEWYYSPVELQYNMNTNYNHKFRMAMEIGLNGGGNWEKIESGDYTGTITMTVSSGTL